MTADAYLVLLCDGPGCAVEGSWPVRFEPHTHRELRRLLRGRGWARRRDGRDLCPDCAAGQPSQHRTPESAAP